jgi:protein kinase A/protein kinase X
LAKKISPPYRPVVKSASDTSNFSSYTETSNEGAEIKPSEDPFLKWD